MGTAVGRFQVFRYRRALTFATLLSLLVLVGAVSAYYVITKRPLTKLPGIQAVTRTVPPRFVTAFYGVSSPFGVAASPDGQRIYVTETSGERQVRVFDRAGNQLGALSAPDSKPGLRMPMYVAVDKTGKVYVADRLRAAVEVYDADGRYLYRFPRDGNPSLIPQPMSVSISQAGDVYITDVVQGQHRVLVFDPNGTLKLGFGKEGSEVGALSYPNGVAVYKGRAFVADSNNARIAVFGADGSPLAVFGSGGAEGTVALPRGIVVDDQERLYVVDTISHLVNVYDLSNDRINFMFSFGTVGLGQGEFSYPNGIAIDDSGRLYVTDRENHRLQVWTY